MDAIFIPGEADDLRGLQPVADSRARVLVLGSMPGPRSLKVSQYYVGRGNRFWRLASDLLRLDLTLPYPERLRHLMNEGVALWDVLALCRRTGALDSAIERGSEVPNDLLTFFDSHPRLGVVALNGKAAARAFHRFVMPTLAGEAGLKVLELPSTSAANARCNYEQLKRTWSSALVA